MITFFVVLLGVTQFGACLIDKFYFIDDQRACWFIKSSKTLECKDLASTSQEEKLSYTLQKYIEVFGEPFQLTMKSRNVMVSGLVWKQKGNQWILSRGDSQKLTLSDMEFHGLYSDHEFFTGEGVVGGIALCKSVYQGKGFECKMPWDETVTMSRTKFVDFFVRLRASKEGENTTCKKLEEIDTFWNVDGRKWRCWNYHFWPVSKRSQDAGVWNYYQFSKKFGDYTYIVEEQPDKLVNYCEFSQKKTQLVGRKVWKCQLPKVRERLQNPQKYPYYRTNYKPRYLPKFKRYRGGALIYTRPIYIKPIISKDRTIETIYAIYLPTGQTAYLTSNQFDDVFVNGGPKVDIDRKNKFVNFQMVNGVVQAIDPVPSKPVSLAQAKTLSKPYDQKLSSLAQIKSAQYPNIPMQRILVVRPIPPKNSPDQNQDNKREPTLEESIEKERQSDPNSYFFGFRGLVVRKYQQKLSIMTPDYSFVSEVNPISFLEKFGANKFEDVVKDFVVNKQDIPINVPPVYSKK